jgi:Xaa-Pro aminopeptidase
MGTQPTGELFVARQERLRTELDKRRLPIFVVSSPVNIFYLTGFHGTAGVVIFERSEAVMWVDPRYTLQARGEARGVEVIEARRGLLKAVGGWLKKRRASVVGYEDLHVSCAEFRSLERESPRTTRWQEAGGIIEDLRMVKDSYEIEQIRQAGHLTAEVLTEVIPGIQPGVRESDLAVELEYRMRRKGADGAAFETIVASGLRGALPHARASAKPLCAGELVILDLGAILAGYAADMTRTLYLGRPGPRVRNLYKAVVEAQQEAVAAARRGVRAGDVDGAARRCLKRRGLADHFTHSTGHGVGLQVHEKPRLGCNEKTRLRAGFVVTAEPGIYMEDLGGVRVEDTVLVGAQGPEVLTPAAKAPWCIE